MRILIADDHPLYREAAALQIRRLYRESEVQEVASLHDLRAATEQTPVFDLIWWTITCPACRLARWRGW